jgi:hypothetical protein
MACAPLLSAKHSRELARPRAIVKPLIFQTETLPGGWVVSQFQELNFMLNGKPRSFSRKGL